MVCAGANIRIEHHIMLRGHLFGLEHNVKASIVLDQFCVQYGFRCGNGFEMDGAGF